MSLTIAMLLHKTVVHDSRVRREASALVQAGHVVVVVELDPDADGTLDGFHRLSASPPPWVKRAMPFRLYRAAFLLWFVARILRLRPDVVHAHDAAMLLPGLIGARLTRAKLVYDSHELATGVPYRNRAWAAFVAQIERLTVPRADAVITVTEGIARQLEKRYRLQRRPTVVRNVCALPAHVPNGALRQQLRIGSAPMVLHQGAVARDRGCEVLITAVSRLPGAHLVFLGSGMSRYARRLARLASERGIGDRAHFLVSAPLEELLRKTAEADVGVTLLQDTCENHRLALPNKVFEYIAAGVPVVSSDLPELRDLVCTYQIGCTVDQTSEDAVVAGLRDALEASRGTALRADVRAAAKTLSWVREQQTLIALYERLSPAGSG